VVGVESLQADHVEAQMVLAMFITFIIIFALGISLRSGRRGGLIAQHRYNNRYNDAAGAREDHLG
jgi:hypothetical protein